VKDVFRRQILKGRCDEENTFSSKTRQGESKAYDGRTTERRIELILEISLESYATWRTDLLSLLLSVSLSFFCSSQV
jgi:hypothetical protein